jgi:tRNA threonylcarbamoyladenosine modification (KEOPS) complex Cgi121 subunit
MLYHLEEYGRFVEIAGYRGIKFEVAEAYLKVHRRQTHVVAVQFFDAEIVATPRHLYFAALNSLQAFKGKTNISKTVAMEAMLYASAQRQILKAIARSGIKPTTQNMAVLIIGENQQAVELELAAVSACANKAPDDRVLEMNSVKLESLKKNFDISEGEIEVVRKGDDGAVAVADLVVERVALLATQF